MIDCSVYDVHWHAFDTMREGACGVLAVYTSLLYTHTNSNDCLYKDMLHKSTFHPRHLPTVYITTLHPRHTDNTHHHPPIIQVCLIMDEVDGMSGSDRGGVQDLIQTIQKSKIPIICLCNDKYNMKLRSLRNYTLELDFRYAYSCLCLFV